MGGASVRRYMTLLHSLDLSCCVTNRLLHVLGVAYVSLVQCTVEYSCKIAAGSFVVEKCYTLNNHLY